MTSGRRPILAIAATPGSTEPLRSLVDLLSTRVDVRPLDQVAEFDERPVGVLAASPRALDFVPQGVPAAVWVADDRELTWVVGLTGFFEGKQRYDEDSLQRMGGAGAGVVVRVILSADPAAIRGGATALSADALDVRALPVLPPLVRSRWRERHDLPVRLVVAVEPDADPSGDAVTNLALAAAAVVTGPLLATALALGTPVVTTLTEAERLGLRAGYEVELAEPETPASRDTLAHALAADDEWAARCSLTARRFAEQALDLGHVADLVLDRLDLSPHNPPSSEPATRLDRFLGELETPPNAPIRARARAAVSSLVPSGHRS